MIKTVFSFGLVAMILTLAVNVAILYGLAVVTVSSVKAATGQCNTRLGVEKYIKGTLFCPEK